MNAEEKIVKALDRVNKGENLYQLALSLKQEGFSQEELYSLFDFFREKHKNDQDDTKYDSILDTMDYIGGFCQPKYAIYGESKL